MALLKEILARIALSPLVSRHLWSATVSMIFGPLARRFCNWLGITFETDEDGAYAEPTT